MKDPKFDTGEIVDVVVERKTDSNKEVETLLDGRVNDRSFEGDGWKYEIEFFYDKSNSWFKEEDLSLL